MRNRTIIYIGNKLAGNGNTPTTIDVLGPRLEIEGYTLYYASDRANIIFRLLHMLYSIVKHARKADLVLVDTYSTWAFYFAYVSGMLSRLLGIKYIPILHGGNLPDRFERSPKMCRLLFGKSYANVVVSGYLQQHLKKVSLSSELIPNSIDIKSYPFLLRKVLKPRLLWVRAFEDTYNPTMALRVLSNVMKTYPEATLAMVGPGKDRSMAECKKLVQEMRIANSVIFTGRLERIEWLKLAREYDIFINTARFDNMPVSVIEAMALGLPVISTNVGGMPFLIENGVNGFLSEDGDADAMASAIITLLQSEGLGEMMSLAARKNAERFSWDSARKKWSALLQEIC